MMRFISLLLLLCSTLYSGFVVAEDEGKKAAYFSLKPSLIANVHGKARYARFDVQLMAKGGENIPDLQLHAPALRHELLLLLGDQKGEDLTNPKGKERFRQAALSAVGQVIKKQTGTNSVKDLFFTSFFVQ
ncbi:MAG: hypothetical protein GY753_19465 [Gammaproteobacteria bacterium]|nr:hypothetical protein [Gammaproteobacteria bacterium]